MHSGFSGRRDRNRTGALRLWRPHAACRVVSDAIAAGRPAPLLLSSAVVCCRRLSPCVGAHWGTDWGSRCFRRRSSPCAEYPLGGWKHLTPGLIRRLFLAKPVRSVRSVRAMSPQMLKCRRLRACRSVPLRSSSLLAVLLTTHAYSTSCGRRTRRVR